MYGVQFAAVNPLFPACGIGADRSQNLYWHGGDMEKIWYSFTRNIGGCACGEITGNKSYVYESWRVFQAGSCGDGTHSPISEIGVFDTEEEAQAFSALHPEGL